MTDHKALIALVRDSIAEDGRSFVYVPAPDAVAALADALESASVERAVVEAQALEQAAEIARRYNKGYALHPHDRPVDDAKQAIAALIEARAVEIREGRQ